MPRHEGFQRTQRIYDQTSDVGLTLLARESMCSLPLSSSFEELDEPGRSEEMLSNAGSAWFTAHRSYRLPCDATDATLRRTHAGQSDTLHRFTLNSSVAVSLNARLAALALDTERRPEEGGVRKSNVGGFQSKANLFAPHDDVKYDRELSSCRVLHGALTAAIEELRVASMEDARDDATPDVRSSSIESFERPLCEGQPLAESEDWLEANRAAHAELMRDYQCVAWLNVNREEHSNKMHFHDPLRLSAVYFVSEGPSEPHGNPRAPDGHLLFRGGKRLLSSAVPTHSFMAVPPVPGTLWVFPGAVPHCVMPYRAARRRSGKPSAPRVSFAFNLLEDAPPPRPER